MKNLLFLLCCLLVFSCKNTPSTSLAPKVAADSLASHLENFIGKKVRIEGKIIHVCPVNGEKMKLLGTNKQIIKIISPEPGSRFDTDWNSKQVCISGTVQELRLPVSYVDSLEKAGALLCHIDHTPCIDTAWVASKHRQGVASQISEKNITDLRKEMEKTGKNYISVPVLVADKVEEIEIVSETVASADPEKAKDTKCNGCPLCGLCLTHKG